MFDCKGRYSEAAILHQDLNPRIQAFCNPWDDLALRAKTLLAALQGFLDKDDDAEILQREVLKITLSEFGQRYKKTLQAMRQLGCTMRSRNQYAQSEQLLSTALQIARKVTRDMDSDLYYNKLYLSHVL